MDEPTLEQMDDYRSLGGEKRRVVTAVVAACLLIGVIYAGARMIYGSVHDETPTEKVGKVPFR